MVKEIINKIKRQLTEQEKIFANRISGKGLILKRCKDSYNSTTKNPNSLITKQAEDLNRHFSKEDTQMTKEHMKRCLTSLVIKEMQVKTIMRYHPASVRMAIEKIRNSKCWRGLEKRKPLYVVSQNGNWCCHSSWRFLKKLEIELPCCCCLVPKLYLTLLQPHGLQLARLLCPWDFSGRNTGMG